METLDGTERFLFSKQKIYILMNWLQERIYYSVDRGPPEIPLWLTRGETLHSFFFLNLKNYFDK